MLIVHLISATPSVAFLASRLHLQHLSAVLEKETCRLCGCHTTSHGRKNHFHQIKSSLFWPVSNNEKDPMTWALELPGKLLLLGQQYIISRVLMLH